MRNELAQLRGEPLPVAEPAVDDIQIEDQAVAAAEESASEPAEAAAEPPAVVVVQRAPEESLLDKILGVVTNFWFIIGAALVLAVAVLYGFMRRAGGGDEEAAGAWESLDADEIEAESVASTERLRALARGSEAIVVVEAERPGGPGEDAEEGFGDDDMLRPSPGQSDATMEIAIHDLPLDAPASDSFAETGSTRSFDGTFSSDSAINLDESDPLAEADFHMAYGLYDQAAELVNGALAADPGRQDLLGKLCEIYFVWGNRDGFVDAASQLKARVAAEGKDRAEWDRIVLMGQQIAGDHELFSGVSAEGVTKAVDLSLGDDADAAAELDIDFASEPGDSATAFFDLGAGSEEIALDESGQVSIAPDSGTGIDFDLGGEDLETETSAVREMAEPAAESIDIELGEEESGETPATAEDDTVDAKALAADATMEIDLDELDLDLSDLEETAVATDIADEADVELIADEESMEEDEEAAIATDIADESGIEAFVGAEAAYEDEATAVAADTTDEGDIEGLIDLDALADIEDTAEGPAQSGDAQADEEIDELASTGRNREVDIDLLGASATREMPGSPDLEETEIAPDAEDIDMLVDTDLRDRLAETGRNPEIDLDDLDVSGAGEMPSIDDEEYEETSLLPGLDPSLADIESTGLMPAIGDDEATELASLDDLEDSDLGRDTSLLDATGHTQVLSEDMSVESIAEAELSDEDATLLAPDYGDEESARAMDEPATLMAPLDDEDEGEFDFARAEALPEDVFGPDEAFDETAVISELAGSTELDLDLDDLTAALKISEVGDTVNIMRDDATVEQPRPGPAEDETAYTGITQAFSPGEFSADLQNARTMTEVGTKLDLARAYVDMGDPDGARSILEEVLDEGDEAQKQQAQKLLDSLPA